MSEDAASMPATSNSILVDPSSASPSSQIRSTSSSITHIDNESCRCSVCHSARINSASNGKSTYYEGGKIGGQIIKKIQKAIENKKVFYSFEYFPPKTREGVQNLFERLDRMSQLEPMFIDVTWGAGGSTADLTLEITSTAQQTGTNEVMMHLTCTNMPKAELTAALDKAKQAGIRNILALRGDPPKGAETWEVIEDGFAHAVDLVRFIRKEYGDYFGIAVAGYPEAHIQAASLDDDIKYLKDKIDAGADFVITQLFYDTDLFLTYVNRCRAAGITCPIIPGIMPIQNYNGFQRMTTFCRTHVPDEITQALEPIKHDDGAVKQFGIDLAIKMCRKLLANGVPGLHFYTLNLEKSVTCILEGLGYVTSRQNLRLPWQQSLVTRRQGKEEVRPIFWANRPRSYIDRTVHWDEFPNGRFGDSSSPAFGDLSDYHLCSYKTGTKDERKKIWGEKIDKPKDVYEVFGRYIEGEINRLPWCENALQLETLPFKQQLKQINHYGYLTINSQPRVNGAASLDPAVGWGRDHGYVYQKAYMEFFCSRQLLEKVIKLVNKEFPAITYMAVDSSGKEFITNLSLEEKSSVNAVTWGVFPNSQILQPTVVDMNSFMVWKEEAFALWLLQWRNIYTPHSPSFELIQEIHDTYFLVNLVDNDFVHGDIFAFFAKVMAE